MVVDACSIAEKLAVKISTTTKVEIMVNGDNDNYPLLVALHKILLKIIEGTPQTSLL